jgi:two-component system NtrC family sensor kinase
MFRELGGLIARVIVHVGNMSEEAYKIVAMGWNRLSIKLMIVVGTASLLCMGAFAWLSITTQRNRLIAQVIQGASQFSDTVKRSTRHAMLENKWEMAHNIMESIGKQEGVAKVRIFNKEGMILFSTEPMETGKVVDKQAESCYACHAAEQPLERLMLPERSRIFRAQAGGRILGMITPIYNEPGCSANSCHAHLPVKRVLGVLDIGLSLTRVDTEVAAMTRKTVIFAGGMTLFIMSILGFLLQRSVIRPVRDLVKGQQRVARGDLDYLIPVHTEDEIGSLAVSFNTMTSALQRTRAELAMLVETLEERVEERTKALQEAQAQLIQSEKLASLGKLSASIAHEINNPLAGILTYVKLAVRKLRNGSPDQDTLGAIVKSLGLVERETGRCATIVRNLLDFARQREPSFEDMDLNAAVSEALSLLLHRMDMQGITLEKSLGDLPAVRADFGQLRQAFVNIALNACEAMENGGTLAVTSRFLPARGIVEVEFTDTGSGISPERLSKIFEPFFTTKKKGTGLGLSVVYGMVERHGGKLEVRSQAGQGTSVVVQLPEAGTVA